MGRSWSRAWSRPASSSRSSSCSGRCRLGLWRHAAGGKSRCPSGRRRAEVERERRCGPFELQAKLRAGVVRRESTMARSREEKCKVGPSRGE